MKPLTLEQLEEVSGGGTVYYVYGGQITTWQEGADGDPDPRSPFNVLDHYGPI